MSDEEYMRVALKEAETAALAGEIPIGAAVVFDGEIIARGHNIRECELDPTGHAEIVAIRLAAERLRRWRLDGCTLYVTVEPCPMCAGALVMSRIARLVYGVYDSRAGACGSLFDIVENPKLNHRVEVRAGVLEDECRKMMKRFFETRRHVKDDGNET